MLVAAGAIEQRSRLLVGPKLSPRDACLLTWLRAPVPEQHERLRVGPAPVQLQRRMAATVEQRSRLLVAWTTLA